MTYCWNTHIYTVFGLCFDLSFPIALPLICSKRREVKKGREERSRQDLTLKHGIRVRSIFLHSILGTLVNLYPKLWGTWARGLIWYTWLNVELFTSGTSDWFLLNSLIFFLFYLVIHLYFRNSEFAHTNIPGLFFSSCQKVYRLFVK